MLETFHPSVRAWFAASLGQPTAPQREGWPLIQSGRHVLIAAPTGTGKTLAAFLSALDGLLKQGPALPDETHVVYVSPLRALSNDVQKNLEAPLAALRALDPDLPEVRVMVRTGDTTAKERAAMIKRPPHVLVTTPESLYILLTTKGGRAMLATARTLIVDEIHALARDKRGSHLALSIERLEHLCAGHRARARVVDAADERTARATSVDGPDEARSPEDRAPIRLPTRDACALQRIGLSATQKPLETVARLLVGADRDCALVDAGHLREIDLDVVVPDSPLSAVCSHEQWDEVYGKMATLVEAHRTTLVFANTRKLAERLAARLTEKLGKGVVGCHHGSLSKETRLDAEQKLKRGDLRVLVATASLELGIDIGDVDLVIQVASPRSIATLLQRVGRAGHGVTRTPKGRVFPLTLDEAVEALALVRAIRRGALDRTPEPPPAIDILMQQIVAACVAASHDAREVAGPRDAAPEPVATADRGESAALEGEDAPIALGGGSWLEDELFELVRRASPYRHLARADFDAAIALHAQGRNALLHRDAVGGRVRATKRARLPAVTSGGAIPDNADYRVLVEPEGTFVGTLNEDFAIESNVNDIFQLGNTSWRVLKVEAGVVRVADAEGAPPTLPFWLGEAPARTSELSQAIGVVRERGVDPEWLRVECRAPREAAEQVSEYLAAGAKALGATPTGKRIVLERFFDESGGMQLVVHSLHGSRVNRALGLALRKRVCRSFGFELQAAANEEAIVISLGLQHSFELESVFDWLSPKTARELLVQALLAAPMFATRWRWNASRALLLPRFQGGKAVPPPLQRMRSEDLLARSFPQALACGETLPPGDIEIPEDHPIVRQTIEDCLTEAMDVAGFLDLLSGLEDDSVEKHAIDTLEPSPFAHGILAAQPYSFLDDAPLEERRTQAVKTRRASDPRGADDPESLCALDVAAVERVRGEAWPDPQSAEEVHEALLWMGFVAEREVLGWRAFLDALAAAGRVVKSGDRWYATEAPRAGKEVLRGRLEALGPVLDGDPLLDEFAFEARELEAEGAVLRARFPVEGSSPLEQRLGWCIRRLLARIHRYTLDRLRKEIEPVTAAEFLRFLCAWQHVSPDTKLEGPRGVLDVVRQLAGFQAPAEAWERHILPARVNGYRRDWLDALAFSGEVAWGRLWGSGTGTAKSLPVALFAREDHDAWLALAEPVPTIALADAHEDDPANRMIRRGVGSTASGGDHDGVDASPRGTDAIRRTLAGANAPSRRGGARSRRDVRDARVPEIDPTELRCDAETLRALLATRGACFQQELARASGLLPSRIENALAELAGLGLAACDSFSGLRALYAAHSSSRRRKDDLLPAAGRWSLFRLAVRPPPAHDDPDPEKVEFLARLMLRRTGVVMRRTLLREKLPIAWRDLVRVYRRMEARGEIHGGRFVAGFSGEQYALPEAVRMMRAVRKQELAEAIRVAAADPLNFVGILTPDERVATNARQKVVVATG